MNLSAMELVLKDVLLVHIQLDKRLVLLVEMDFTGMEQDALNYVQQVKLLMLQIINVNVLLVQIGLDQFV
jgi:hypothetical protein